MNQRVTMSDPQLVNEPNLLAVITLTGLVSFGLVKVIRWIDDRDFKITQRVRDEFLNDLKELSNEIQALRDRVDTLEGKMKNARAYLRHAWELATRNGSHEDIVTAIQKAEDEIL